MLIKSYEQRMERQALKHEKALKFLRDETWTSSKILGLLLEASLSSVLKTMLQLERLGYVVRQRVFPHRFDIWGITAHGLAYSWSLEDVITKRPCFEPAKLSALAIPHRLDVQKARISAERAGWSDWRPENILPAGMAKRPDALVLDTQGRVIAIEVERHIKTLKRYEAVFSSYLQAIKRGELEQVHYVTPNRGLAIRLSRVLSLVQAVPLLGERVTISDRHRARFLVTSLSDWPPANTIA